MKRLSYLWEINSPSRFIRFCKNFGFSFACKHLLFQNLAIASKYHLPYQHNIIVKFLTDKFKNEIQELGLQQVGPPRNRGKIPVWVLWWQGEADMPEPVELCIRSHKRYLDTNKYEYHLLTKENLSQFIDIPSFIQEKVDKGFIHLTHLSEIIRVGILRKHGGLWMDASLLMVDDFGHEMHELDFYSNKKFSSPWRMRRHIAGGRWISGFMKVEPGNLLCEFLWQVFLKYWSQYDVLINYFVIDYLIEVAYQQFPSIKKQIDAVPENNIRYYDLMQKANNKMDLAVLNQLFANHSLFFFSRKQDYKKTTAKGEKTVYQYLLNFYGLS